MAPGKILQNVSTLAFKISEGVQINLIQLFCADISNS